MGLITIFALHVTFQPSFTFVPIAFGGRYECYREADPLLCASSFTLNKLDGTSLTAAIIRSL